MSIKIEVTEEMAHAIVVTTLKEDIEHIINEDDDADGELLLALKKVLKFYSPVQRIEEEEAA